MTIVIHLLGTELFRLDLSIPKVGIFTPGLLPDSTEAFETWVIDDE